MRIGLVLAPQNASWVIGKMAHRLCDALNRLGHLARVSAAPDPGADVNHWMSFAFADGCESTLNTVFVTHADDPYKVRLIRDLLMGRVQLALCMSPHAAQELRELGVPGERISYVLPAMDEPIPPRLMRIGITTRVYDDGRKREALLMKLARDMRLEDFHFDIFGAGWDGVITLLQRAGAQVSYDPGSNDWQGDYSRIRAAIPSFDYYLYLGMDEGSLGTLDAVSAGVKTIVTAQGFHLELPGGIDHPFTEYQELLQVFRQLAEQAGERRRRLAMWTWDVYAQEHAGIWEAMLRASPACVSEPDLVARSVRRPGDDGHASRFESVGKVASGRMAFKLRLLSPARVRGALARTRLMRPLRKLLGH